MSDLELFQDWVEGLREVVAMERKALTEAEGALKLAEKMLAEEFERHCANYARAGGRVLN